MCNETMSSAEYNQFVLDNVLDGDGSSEQIPCQECGKEALERTFERCYGGAINQYYAINCNHCGFHQCDQEVCHICEQDCVEPKGYNEAPKVELIVESLVDSLRAKSMINPISWSFLKLYTLRNPELVDWYHTFYIYDDEGIRSPSDLFHYLKKQLLDERFTIWLDRRIKEAKHATDFH